MTQYFDYQFTLVHLIEADFQTIPKTYQKMASWNHEKCQQLSSNPASPSSSSSGIRVSRVWHMNAKEIGVPSWRWPISTILFELPTERSLSPAREVKVTKHFFLACGSWLSCSLSLAQSLHQSLPVWTLSRAGTPTIKTTVIRQICFGAGLR